MLKDILKPKALVSKQYIYRYLLSILLIVCITFAFTYSHYNDIAKENTNSDISQTTEEENIEDSNIPSDSDIEIEEQVGIDTSIPETPTTNSETKTNTKPTTPETTPNTDPAPDEEPETIPVVPESPSAIVAFYGDNQSDTDEEDINHQRAVTYILNSGANPVFNVGDIMEDGTQSSLDRFNTVTATLRATRTFYAALGNNDRLFGDATTPSPLYFDNFSFPNNEQWYSVNYGNLHVVVLDSAFSSGNSSQLNWLSSDLQSANSQNKITCVMFHHPTFASTISSYLVNYGVDFVVSGHLHSYSHSVSSGINYFVLSGQPAIGYIKAKIYESKVEITAYNSGNGVIETIEFNER